MNTSVPVKGNNLAAKRCIRMFNFSSFLRKQSDQFVLRKSSVESDVVGFNLSINCRNLYETNFFIYYDSSYRKFSL